jgi:DNA adenine methylase
MTSPAPVSKIAGAKWRVADWLVSHFPPHATYLEPFFGSGAAFFTKQPAPVELINDLDCNVVNLFQILRTHAADLALLMTLTPWCQDEYHNCVIALREPFTPETSSLEQRLERARQFLTASWQMFGRKNVTSRNGWRHRYLASKSPVVGWNKLPDRILNAAERLMHTQISRENAVKLIRNCNNKDVLIYADPPYLAETRGHGNLYHHEFKTPEQHLELIDALESHLGSVVLSGYDSSLYAAHLKHWQRFEIAARVQSNQCRTEVIWLNPTAKRRLGISTQSTFEGFGDEL